MSDRQGPAAGLPPQEKRRSLWRHADFMKLWSAETVSQLGTQVTMLALPLTAILILRATAFQVGLLTTLEFLPFILVGLPAGVWVDRLRRRPILIVGDLGRALVLGSIPIAYEMHALHIAHLYAAAFVTGIFTVFFDVSYQSYLPSLVAREQLVDGNAKLEVSRSGAQLAGPGLGGLLIELVTAPVAILADAISYLGSALLIFAIRRKEPAVHREGDDGSRPTMRRQIGEGLRYVLGHRLLRPIAACTATANLFSSMMLAVLVLFAVRVLGLTPGLIGILFAIGNVGLLVAAFLPGVLTRKFGVGRTIVGAAVVFSLPFLLIPLATKATAFVLLVTAWTIAGLGSTVYNITQVSLRQSITPERMQGRMNATMRFMVWGTMPIGSFIGGVLGSRIGLRPTLWVGAIGGAFAFIPPLLSPVRTLRTMEEAQGKASTAAEPAGGGDTDVEEASPGTVAEVLAAKDDGAVELGRLPHPVEGP